MKVWTFLIHGGKPFELQLAKNPSLEHTGKRTLWKMFGTKEEAEEAKVLILGFGGTVEVSTESQSEEQIAERLLLLGHQ